MITPQLISTFIQRKLGIAILDSDGNQLNSIDEGTKYKELFMDVRANPPLIYDRTLKYIGDGYFENEDEETVQTFCAALVKVE